MKNIIKAICDWAGPRNVLFTYGLECMEPFAERNFDSKELEMYRDLQKRFQVRTLYERFRLAVTHAGKSFRMIVLVSFKSFASKPVVI